ncbi:glycosyl transferase [Photobacterium iliopiscarium]|uniref:glycosyltransferase family 2 protein n=1 Tax=Photobacterium iliopiscarium TaxID=56192 RepID=UPI000D17DFF0|nr:glycosyltransferase family 2 protein [Photobacterium iliopiscarium]PST87755.1 glycosyl transferase [Photobacterium iliopiscarium]
MLNFSSEYNEKVSIIMPTYNSKKTVLKSIESILSQTYTNIEICITDDNSYDGTFDILKEIAKSDCRIKLFRNKYSRSASNARNNSIKNATGTYISFLDSDDTWYPRKLELQIEAMKKNNCFASHSSYYRVDENGNNISLVKPREKVTYKDMLTHNHIGNLTGIYNAKILSKFYQKNIGHEDYEMWLRILSKTDSIAVLEPLASYTVSTESLSSNKFKAAKWHYNILRNEIGLNTLKSSFYFSHYIFNAIKTRTNKVS